MKLLGTSNEANRVAWVQQALAGLPAGSRLLDAGAGEQPFRKFCAHLNYVSQDFAEYDPRSDPTGLQMSGWDYGRLDIVSDLARIPQPDGSFDAILCTEVLEHIPDPLAALGEFARLLRPGGELILTAPFCSLTHFAPYHYASGFNRYFYEYHLPRLKFEVREISANGSFFEYLGQELRRVPGVCDRYAQRKMGLVGKFILGLNLILLTTWSRRDQGSAELLAFGYHVRAVKV